MGHRIVLDARVHSVSGWDANASEHRALLRRDGVFLSAVFKEHSLDAASLDAIRQLANESLIRVSGHVISQEPSTALTIHVSEVSVLSKAKQTATVASIAARHGALGEKAASQDTIEQRLDNRLLDARVAATAAVFKLSSGVHELAVEFLARRQFYRIATPTLVGYMYPGEEDDHFSVPYFDRTAWLAPTGEVHLGMALAADMERVYDLHQVFRRELHADSRHLSEFTMLELVFSLNHGWTEILDLVDDFLIFVIQSLQEHAKYTDLLQTAQRLYPSAGTFRLGLVKGRFIRITFDQAKSILQSSLRIQSNMQDDFTPEEEAALGRFFSSDQSHLGPPTDIFVITHFPKYLRPCNVYPSEDGSSCSTRSFDVIMRGREIITGCQLMHSADQLRAAFASRPYPIDPDSPGWRPFVTAHEIGMPPWGGFGMGLDRFLQSFLGLDDIRETVLFPRNAARLRP